jgi:glycosyltransferase involved in cell wall biosynthesis
MSRLKGAQIFAMPSVREGFGISVVEAQACGLVPVVSNARHNASQQLVRDGETGLVRSPTAEDFADAFAELLSNPDRRAAMALEALADSKLRDWSRIADRAELVYEAAARQTSGSRMRLTAAVPGSSDREERSLG